MKRDAIEKIEELTLAAHAVETVSAEQRGVYFLRGADGTLERHRAKLDPAGAELHTIADLVAAVARDPGVHRIFVNNAGAVATATDGHAAWIYTLPLPVHPVFELLESMKRGQTMKQKQIVRLLRTQLGGYVPDSVIENLRLVKTSSASSSEALTAQGNKHVDLSIRRAATLKDGNAIPESFRWCVPVFDLPELLSVNPFVTVLLDVEPAERADDTEFTLTPRHDDLHLARQEALDALVKQIREHEGLPAGLPVLRGAPAKKSLFG